MGYFVIDKSLEHPNYNFFKDFNSALAYCVGVNEVLGVTQFIEECTDYTDKKFIPPVHCYIVCEARWFSSPSGSGVGIGSMTGVNERPTCKEEVIPYTDYLQSTIFMKRTEIEDEVEKLKEKDRKEIEELKKTDDYDPEIHHLKSDYEYIQSIFFGEMIERVKRWRKKQNEQAL